MSKASWWIGAAIIAGAAILLVSTSNAQNDAEQQERIKRIKQLQTGFIRVGKYTINRLRIDYTVTDKNGGLEVYMGGNPSHSIYLPPEAAKQFNAAIDFGPGELLRQPGVGAP